MTRNTTNLNAFLSIVIGLFLFNVPAWAASDAETQKKNYNQKLFDLFNRSNLFNFNSAICPNHDTASETDNPSRHPCGGYRAFNILRQYNNRVIDHGTPNENKKKATFILSDETHLQYEACSASATESLDISSPKKENIHFIKKADTCTKRIGKGADENDTDCASFDAWMQKMNIYKKNLEDFIKLYRHCRIPDIKYASVSEHFTRHIDPKESYTISRTKRVDYDKIFESEVEVETAYECSVTNSSTVRVSTTPSNTTGAYLDVITYRRFKDHFEHAKKEFESKQEPKKAS